MERAVEKIYCSFILPKNCSQSAQNDVGAANDKQASYLLAEIGKRLDRQDRTLEAIMEKLEQLEEIERCIS